MGCMRRKGTKICDEKVISNCTMKTANRIGDDGVNAMREGLMLNTTLTILELWGEKEEKEKKETREMKMIDSQWDWSRRSKNSE